MPSRSRLSCADAFGREQHVRQLIGQHPVDLLRHGAVEASQPGFDMRDRDAHLRGDERAGERRVDIADDEDQVGRPLENADSKPAMTAAVCCAWLPEPTSSVTSGGSISSSSKNICDRSGVVVLAGMDQPGRKAAGSCRELALDRRNLHEVGTRASDGHDPVATSASIKRLASEAPGRHQPGGIAEHLLAGSHVSHDDRAGTNGAPVSDLQACAYGGIHADVAAFSKVDPPGNVCARRHGGETTEDAVMTDRRIQIDGRVFFDHRIVRDGDAGIDDGAWRNTNAASRDERRMNRRDEGEGAIAQALSDSLLDPRVGNPDDIADVRAVLRKNPVQPPEDGQSPDDSAPHQRRVVQETQDVGATVVPGCFPKNLQRSATVIARTDDNDALSEFHETEGPFP